MLVPSARALPKGAEAGSGAYSLGHFCFVSTKQVECTRGRVVQLCRDEWVL